MVLKEQLKSLINLCPTNFDKSQSYAQQEHHVGRETRPMNLDK